MSEETIPQMREALDKANARNKDLEKSVSELSGENRVLKARDIALGQGYEANSGELFAQANPEADITAEALDAFIQKFPGLASQNEAAARAEGEGGASEEGESSTDGGAGSSSLADMARGGSRPGESAGGASQEMMTRQEWQELMANDPIAGREAVRQGRVAIASDNPFGDAKAVAVGRNPYAS